jgi:cytochrome c553
LPKLYILEQIAAFRAGERGLGGPLTAHDMFDEARTLTSTDLQRSVDYFSGMPFVSRVHVVETASVPETHWKYFVQVPDQGGAREPIGERIIETPANFHDYEYGAAHVDYVACVPPGSIARGALIAAKGAGSVAACESCHGASLEGADMPGIGIAPMRAEVSHLTLRDMIDVAAYAASRKP